MVSIKIENGVALVAMDGSITSGNAAELDKAIFEFPGIADCSQAVIDAEALEYISSAGLRVLLKMRKKWPRLQMRNVSPAVYEILEITGFSEMIDVRKAYRKLSVEGCEVIGEGSNGIVYRYDPETIVKVYKKPDALEEIERERVLARQALVLGIPTAIPYDVVRVGSSYGSVFELLKATSFSKLIANDPANSDKVIADFVDLLKQIHGTEVKTDILSDARAVALDWAKYLDGHLPGQYSAKLIALIEALPERHTMIHGDYHTNNVKLLNGEALLIDMDTLSYGHPVLELASMFLGFVGFGEVNPAAVEKFLKLPYSLTTQLWPRTLARYLGTEDPERIREVEDKAKVLGYTRLLRRTIKRIGCDDPEGARLIENCKNKLIDLLDRVDTLEF